MNRKLIISGIVVMAVILLIPVINNFFHKNTQKQEKTVQETSKKLNSENVQAISNESNQSRGDVNNNREADNTPKERSEIDNTPTARNDAENVIFGVAVLVLFVSVILFFAVPFILLVSGISAVVIFSQKQGAMGDKKKPIFFQVPSNHVWVLRAFIGSDPGRPLYSIYDEPNAYRKLIQKGKTSEEAKKHIKEIEDGRYYWKKKEGLNFWIPGLMIDEGVYNIEPRQRKVERFEVNSRDKLKIFLDMQLTTYINNPIRFAISMEGNTVEEKSVSRTNYENELLHTASNHACRKYNSEELQALICHIDKADKSEEMYAKLWRVLTRVYPKDKREDPNDKTKSISFIKYGDKEITEFEKDKFWEIAVKKFKGQKEGTPEEYFEAPLDLGLEIKEELMRLYIDKLYGLRIGQIGIKNIYTPDEVSRALEKERATVIQKRTAKNEGEALKEKYDLIGADPTKAFIADTAADVVRSLGGILKGDKKKKE